MFLTDFVKDPGKLAQLQNALGLLSEIGFFQVLLEASYERAGAVDSVNVLEMSTLKRGFHLGYFQCVQDMYHFKEFFVYKGTDRAEAIPDWGASKLLMEKEGWTEKEIKDARNTRGTSTRNKK